MHGRIIKMIKLNFQPIKTPPKQKPQRSRKGKKPPLEKELYRKIEQWLGIMPGVIWFERLNSGRVKTAWGTWIKLARKGTADYIAAVFGGGIAHILFVEGKRKGEKQTKEQKWFEEHVLGAPNVHYLLIEEVLPMIEKINEISFMGCTGNDEQNTTV